MVGWTKGSQDSGLLEEWIVCDTWLWLPTVFTWFLLGQGHHNESILCVTNIMDSYINDEVSKTVNTNFISHDWSPKKISLWIVLWL